MKNSTLITTILAVVVGVVALNVAIYKSFGLDVMMTSFFLGYSACLVAFYYVVGKATTFAMFYVSFINQSTSRKLTDIAITVIGQAILVYFDLMVTFYYSITATIVVYGALIIIHQRNKVQA